MRGSPPWRGARPHEADERRPLRDGGSEWRVALGQLAVLISAVALTTLPFTTTSARAPALLLFLLGWFVMKSAEDGVRVRSPNALPPAQPRKPDDPS